MIWKNFELNNSLSAMLMKTPNSILSNFIFVLRVLLGGYFAYLGWVKASDPVIFLKTLREFELAGPYWFTNIIAAWLPWFEIWVGILLVLGIAVRSCAMFISCLLLAFIAIIAYRAFGIVDSSGEPFCSIKFDCGCGSGEVYVCPKLATNSAMFFVSSLIAFLPHHRLAIWPSITSTPTKHFSQEP